MDNGLVIKANSDASIAITFKNTYNNLPLVVPVVYSKSNVWGYITTMVSMLTKTGCTLNFHNFDNTDVTVCVGYIIMG